MFFKRRKQHRNEPAEASLAAAGAAEDDARRELERLCDRNRVAVVCTLTLDNNGAQTWAINFSRARYLENERRAYAAREAANGRPGGRPL